MIRVLVTGGAGYIGSHTAKALSRSGYEPVVLDNFSTGHGWAVKWGPVIKGDLADTALICEVLRAYKVHAVIHLAASAYVAESIQQPRKYFRNNVANTLNLLEAAIDFGLRYVVFSSTCATYGVPSTVPIIEEQVQIPINPYGESKRFAEKVLQWFGSAYGLNWAVLRYFNAAGADGEGEIGETHSPETHLIPAAIESAFSERQWLELYGTDYPTPDGTAIRDYIHVTDLAEAHVLALQYLFAGGKSIAVNLGTGVGHSVREIIAAVERVSGRRVPLFERVRRLGDPPVLIADPGNASRTLGWTPRFSGLDTMVETALRWHAARPDVDVALPQRPAMAEWAFVPDDAVQTGTPADAGMRT
jgi:UDP-arabinose 4-epimerase